MKEEYQQSDTNKCRCPVDNRQMTFLFRRKVLGKYHVSYFRCNDCGLISTEAPYWLDEAYGNAIAGTDIGILSRNNHNAKLVSVFLNILKIADEIVVDTAGGYGILTRLLRDRGINCFSYDKYCKNIFSENFDGESVRNAKIILAFEVMEHLHDPMAFLKENLNRYHPDMMIFSTLTFKEEPPPDWWYYSLHTGQHITFYQTGTLQVVADRLGLYYYSVNESYHLFSRHKISGFKLFLMRNKIAITVLGVLYSKLYRHRNLLQVDYDEIVSNL